jgi:hypothetical protein
VSPDEPKDRPIPFPAALWDDLLKVDPKKAALNAGAEYAEGVFFLDFLGARFTVDLNARLVSGPPDRTRANFDKALVLVIYLAQCGRSDPPDPAGRLIGPLELPSGAMFFRGPHVIATAPLEEGFGKNPQALTDKAFSMGAQPAPPYLFSWRVLPKIDVACMLYPEDEEFPAKATYLIDAHSHYYLALDAVWALFNVVTAELLAKTA